MNLGDLRNRVADSPSFSNRLALAQALHDQGKYDEAKALFSQLARQDPSDAAVLYGFGRCLLELSMFDDAIETLETLVSKNPAHEDYDGWLLLAEVHEERNDAARELEVLSQLVTHTQRIEHRIAWAEALVDAGEHRRGQEELARALRENDSAPAHVRQRARGAVRRAKGLLRPAKAGSGS